MPVLKNARQHVGSLYPAIVGAILGLIGTILVIGGGWLISLGGSPFYLIAGVGLLASGVLLFRSHLLGAWIYLATWMLSILWGLIEVGFDVWGLIPFVAGPTILLVLVLCTLPQMGGFRWRTPIGAAGLIVLAIVIAGFAIAHLNRSDPGAMPRAFAAGMTDPSPMRTGSDWPAYGGSYAAQRYSPLGQVTPANVKRLQRAWVHNTATCPLAIQRTANMARKRHRLKLATRSISARRRTS